MSTPNITPSAKYSGNGVATEFAVPFPYLDKSYVSVYVKRGLATQVKLSSTDFDFTNDTYIIYPKAGSIDAILTSNDIIVVKRETPVKSDYVFDNQVRLFPEDVMNADDLSFQIIQEQADEINRAIKVSETSSANPDDVVPAIESIYSNLTQISAVINNIDDVNTCASNITDIQNASTNAQTATTKASEASASATSASNSATQALSSAQNALTQANNASDSATQALSSAQNALTQANSASASASSASTDAAIASNTTELINTVIIPNLTDIQNASTNAQTATTKASDANNSATSASASAAQALSSAQNALTQANNASDSATQALSSATTALNQANSASASASSASTNAQTATTKATEATSSASSASTSSQTATTQAGIATTKAKEAKASATSASDSATNASNSAAQALSSAQNALTQANNASDSATQALSSATTALNQANSASASASSASTNAQTATTKATEATSSASSASTSSQTATTQAGIATTKAKEAKASATSANNSATTATQSADTSRKWAEGTDSEVQGLGGVHSSKGWSEAAQAVVDGKQDISNLSQTLDNSTTKYPSNKAVKNVTDTKQSISNLSQTLDNSTTKYPSNKAVKTAIDANGSLPSQTGQNGKFLTTNGTTASWGDVGGGLEIGDIGFAPLGIDEAQNKRRYLNGQVISQAQFVSFTNKIKAAIQLYSNLATTEANWQAEKTNSKLGQCGKFVIDDTAGTIRLPKVVNINGLQDLSLLGGIKTESLPNITGTAYNILMSLDTTPGGYGALNATKTGDEGVSGSNYNRRGNISFNASLSSSTYQDNAPVQQEAIQYPYFIQVATGIEETLPAIREYEINTPFFFGQSMWTDVVPYNASWLLSNGQSNASTLYPDLWTQLTGVELNGSLSVGDTIEISGKTYVKRGLPVVLSTDPITGYEFVVNTADSTFRLPLLNGQESIFSGLSGWSLYYYVGDTVQDASLINAGAILGQLANLANKADTDLSNITATGKETVVGWGMPDYSAGVSATYPYTASKKGYFMGFVYGPENSTVYYLYVNGNIVGGFKGRGSRSEGDTTINIPMNEGDVLTCSYSFVGQCVFYPVKGA